MVDSATESPAALSNDRVRTGLQRFETARESLDGLTESPPQGNSGEPVKSILTGKQEHYLKRELLSQQTKWEISELSSPTALQRFGAPFRSDEGEVPPQDSQLPLLRYIFVHHVRNFPFLDQAREKEFWQDKLQVFLESFATKHISTSDDRLEETKRHKLALKAEKLVELMMVSGIPTASGYEERIRFSEMEIIDRGANESGLTANLPEGNVINGWDVNVAAVRLTSIKRTVRYHTHAVFVIQSTQDGVEKTYVGRRYGDFARLQKQLRLEVPSKQVPPLPRKNRASAGFHSVARSTSLDDDSSSFSSISTQDTQLSPSPAEGTESPGGLRASLGIHGRHKSISSSRLSVASSTGGSPSPDPATVGKSAQPHVLHREQQRVSLRAFLRSALQIEQVAHSQVMKEFLTKDPIALAPEDTEDIEKRKAMDIVRIEEQKRFYEMALQRAHDLDTHMEKFRRDIVENNGLFSLFEEIRKKNRLEDLDPYYKKFAEWVRIEVSATLYHLFLAEDNSADLFAQFKRIHGLVPYGTLKNVIRFANPAAVMKGVLDLFLAQPLGARSLLQRVFSMALNDGIRTSQKRIDDLQAKINDPVLCEKLKNYTYADEDFKCIIRQEANDEQNDLLVTILRTEYFEPVLESEQVSKVFNAYVAWNHAVEHVDMEMRQGVELYSQLKMLLKVYIRQRDKTMMMNMIEEPTTLKLFRDLFVIFYEPLVRVYKSANVYNSITDFAVFADDIVKTVEAAQRQDFSADPNQTVQSFIDLCQRHEHNLYKFIHEVHIHDNDLFNQIIAWLEGILEFLRHGPRGGKLDINALFQGAVESGQMEKDVAIEEIDRLIQWQTACKKWHSDKTRQKMAAEGNGGNGRVTTLSLGLDEHDLSELGLGGSSDDDSELDGDGGDANPIEAERTHRSKNQDTLRRRAGQPPKPDVCEVHQLNDGFVSMLRMVLAE